MALTEAQKTQFFQDGYIVVKELLTTDELATLRKHYADLALGQVPDFPERNISHYTPSPAPAAEPPTPHTSQHDRRGTQVYPKGEVTTTEDLTPVDDPLDTINHLNLPSYYDSVFKAFVRSPKIVDIIESLMGPQTSSSTTTKSLPNPLMPKRIAIIKIPFSGHSLPATSKSHVKSCLTMRLLRTVVCGLSQAATTSVSSTGTISPTC